MIHSKWKRIYSSYWNWVRCHYCTSVFFFFLSTYGAHSKHGSDFMILLLLHCHMLLENRFIFSFNFVHFQVNDKILKTRCIWSYCLLHFIFSTILCATIWIHFIWLCKSITGFILMFNYFFDNCLYFYLMLNDDLNQIR